MTIQEIQQAQQQALRQRQQLEQQRAEALRKSRAETELRKRKGIAGRQQARVSATQQAQEYAEQSSQIKKYESELQSAQASEQQRLDLIAKQRKEQAYREDAYRAVLSGKAPDPTTPDYIKKEIADRIHSDYQFRRAVEQGDIARGQRLASGLSKSEVEQRTAFLPKSEFELHQQERKVLKSLGISTKIYSQLQSTDALKSETSTSGFIGSGAVVDLPPSFTQRYKTIIESEGKIKGTKTFFFRELGRLYSEREIKKGIADPSYESYQRQSITKAIEVLPTTALYFTPIGSGLLFAEGIEDVGTKSGRERLDTQKMLMEREGASSTFANVMTYAPPVLGIALGGLGLKSQFKNYQIKSELRAFDKTPSDVYGWRIETGKGEGVDILKTAKNVKGATYYSEIKQPFVRTESGVTYLEGGMGYSARIKGGKIQASFFETSGRSKPASTPKRFTQTLEEPYLFREPTKVSLTLEEAQAGLTRLRTTEYATAKGKIKAGFDFYTGKPKITGKIKATTIKKPTTETDIFLSASKQQDNLIFSLGAKAEKIGINRATGEKNIYGKISENVFMRRKLLELPADNIGFVGGGSKSSSQYFKQLYGLETYQTPLIQKSFELVKPATSKVITSPTGSIIAPTTTQEEINILSPATATKQEEISKIKDEVVQSNLIGLKLNEKSKSKMALKFAEAQQPKEIFNVAQTPKLEIKEAQKIKTAQSQRPRLRQLLEQRSAQTTQTTTRPQPETPRPRKLIIPPILDLGKGKTKRQPTKREIFKAVSRRFGKEITIGKFTSKEQAEKILKKYIFGGLARSGAIKKSSGEALDLDLGSAFRKAKSQKLKGFVVQKNPLQFGTETREIQMFKKQSKKKKVKKSLFF